MANRSFVFNDITISRRTDINIIGSKWAESDCQQPNDLLDWDTIVPKMDIGLDVASNEMHYVTSIIPTLKWRGGKLGVRLAFLPKDIAKLFGEYRGAYFSAHTTEHTTASKKTPFTLFPKDLCEFLDRKLTTYFSIRAFILDPVHFGDTPIQPTSFESECLTDNPLKGIIKLRPYWESIEQYAEVNDENRLVILSHYPILFYKNQHYGAVMLYGHVHNTREWKLVEKWKNEQWAMGIPSRLINVGCMMDYMRYTPCTLTELLDANPMPEIARDRKDGSAVESAE